MANKKRFLIVSLISGSMVLAVGAAAALKLGKNFRVAPVSADETYTLTIDHPFYDGAGTSSDSMIGMSTALGNPVNFTTSGLYAYPDSVVDPVHGDRLTKVNGIDGSVEKIISLAW